MSRPVVTLVETGIANTASVAAAFIRCGAESQPTRDRRCVEDAELLVLPGVGSFGAGMERLETDGLADPIRERVAARRPTLAICLGLQLLCASSEESPGVVGLGVIDGAIEAFPDSVRRPQFGWNRVVPRPGCTLIEPGDAYFANSYRLREAPQGWSAGVADHAGPFVAALENGPVLACQFHPELSGPWGAGVLRRWLAGAREGALC